MLTSIHFGYGNAKQHPAVIRGSIENEAKRLEKGGRLPEGMTRQDFVACKMAERARRDRRK